MKKIMIGCCLVFAFCSVGVAAPSPIYQGSTIEALLAGNYDGVATVQDIKAKGDMGLGTFAGLDGEMIVLDGKVYKAAKTGKVTMEADSVQSPFYAVTRFEAIIGKQLQGVDLDYGSLKQELDGLRRRSDVPYAIVIQGTFKAIQVRSVGPYEKPFPLLAAAVQEQSVFEYANVSGCLVGFWLPGYLGNANAAGYHLHFLADDRQTGGHVLNLRLTDGKIGLDEKNRLEIEFAPYQTIPLETADRYQS